MMLTYYHAPSHYHYFSRNRCRKDKICLSDGIKASQLCFEGVSIFIAILGSKSKGEPLHKKTKQQNA